MNVADSLGRWADETPFAAAIVDRTQVIHYRDLDRAVWRAASWLRDNGVRSGDRVGVSLGDNSAILLVVVYALARMGAVLMLLPPTEVPSIRLALARRFHLAAVVGDDDAARLDGLPLLRPSEDWFRPGPAAIDPGLRVEGGAAPWRIALSSGTTGAPKAMMRTHGDQVRLSEIGLRQVVGAGGRFLTLTALQFVFGLSQPLLTLHGGGMVRVVQLPIAIPELCAVIDRERITHVTITPTFARDLLRHFTDGKPRFPGLRNLALCTMAAPDTLRREIRRRITPNLVIYYATNESWYLTVADVKAQDEFPETVGFPVEGIEIQIVDEQGRKLAPGQVGLIRVGGSTLPTGYVDDPEATAKAFRDGWYYPGDLGFLSPDGALFLKGRTDDAINYDGVKIYPTDIETALLQHPSVSEAAAFPLTSEEFRQVPVAAVVLRGPASPQELVAFSRERLGARAPKWVYALPNLPKTPTGKVITRQLAHYLSERLSDDKTGP